MRAQTSALVIAGILTAVPCAAQGLGIGGRMSMVRGDVQASTSAERFIGGQFRLPLSPRSTLEVSVDRRTDTNEALTEKTVEIPIQGSLLLYPVRTTFSPYVLGGIGWYTHRLEQLSGGAMTTSESSRRVGYHAGLGGELKLGRHAGVHADYRYTFLRFGGDDEEDESIVSRFKPSYEGSMWTAGMTLYF